MRLQETFWDADEDARECVNDAYLALWNQNPAAGPGIPGAAFAAGIVRKISLDRLDYNTASCRCANTAEILDQISEILPDESAEIPQGDTLTEILNRFLASEKKRDRVVFVRRYWFCDSVREIAARTGMSESGVRSLLFRIRKRLSAYLKKEGYHFE